MTDNFLTGMLRMWNTHQASCVTTNYAARQNWSTCCCISITEQDIQKRIRHPLGQVGGCVCVCKPGFTVLQQPQGEIFDIFLCPIVQLDLSAYGSARIRSFLCGLTLACALWSQLVSIQPTQHTDSTQNFFWMYWLAFWQYPVTLISQRNK